MAFALQTDLSIDECRARIASAVSKTEPLFPAIAYQNISKEFRGSINERNFRIEKQRLLGRIPYRVFYGTLVAEDQGTLIEGYFESDPVYRLGLIFFVGFAALMGILFLILALADTFSQTRYSVDAFQSFWSIVLIVLVATGVFWWAARSEEIDILNFLEDLLEAKSTET